MLAEHTPPSSVVAVGEGAGARVLIAATLAEAGSNVIGVDLQGRKRWGMSIESWRGPRAMTSDGEAVYALHSRGAGIWRVDPATGEKAKVMGGVEHEVVAIAATSALSVVGEASGGVMEGGVEPGKLLLIARSREDRQSAFGYAIGNGAIDATRSRPQVLDAAAATEFLISPRTAFANVFTTPGNPQNAAGMVVKGGDAYTVVVFDQPVTFGSMLLGPMGGVAGVEVYALKEGTKYEDEMSPLDSGGGAGGGDGSDGLDGFKLDEFDQNWRLIGSSDVERRLNLLTPDAAVTTGAIYIKAAPPMGVKADWKPGLKMARLLRERVERVPLNGASVVERAGDAVQPDAVVPAEASPELGWNYQTTAPISEVYPTHVVLDLGGEVKLDGLALLNCVNPKVEVAVYEGEGNPVAAAGDDAAWRTVAIHKGKRDKKLRWLSASTEHNEAFIPFDKRETTRAIRFRILDGYRAGKWGRGDDDPYRVACDAVAVLRSADAAETAPPSHVFMVLNARTGTIESEDRSNAYDIAAIGVTPEGKAYAATPAGLHRGTISGGELTHELLEPSRGALKNPLSMAVNGDRVVVGDGGRKQVVVFDLLGKPLHAIGNGPEREPGPWDPMTIAKPTGVALAADGSIWVAEASYAPKRVARYAADGTFIEEHLGPTMYGGGGYLDPDLRSFYYRQMHFALDWERGTSRLAALDDQMYDPGSPIQNGSTFGGTSAGRPLYLQNHR